jgi:2-methylisocitrate lyase-like PEP mutase family enzyme
VRATTKLRNILQSGRIAVAPGAFDGLSARLVAQAGFPAVYASGGAIARSAGLPDLGLLPVDTIVDRLAAMVDVVDVPVIADADTGYGNALNAQAASRAFERAGVAAFHLEDQTFPKKCGHYDDKGIVPTAEMVQKLKAVRDALHDPDFIVIARTDALAVEGFDAALARASVYLEAGADMIFVEAPTSEAEIPTLPGACRGSNSSTCSPAARRRWLRCRGSKRSATTSSSSRVTPSAPPSRPCSACSPPSLATAAPPP